MRAFETFTTVVGFVIIVALLPAFLLMMAVWFLAIPEDIRDSLEDWGSRQ